MTPLRGVRGDVGIRPYGRSIEVRWVNGRSIEMRRVTGEVQNGRGQKAPSCTAVFALSALFGEKRVHITTVEKVWKLCKTPCGKG